MKESTLVKKIQTYLDTLPKRWHFKAHGSIFGQIGVPDIIGLLSSPSAGVGRFFAIEVKINNNGLSMMQRVILEKIRSAGGLCGVARSLEDAIAILDGRSTFDTDSPMEFLFLQEAIHRLPGLVSQYPIPPFVADFAIPDRKIVVEIDGKDYHDRACDEKRDAYLTGQGWRVIRFSGAEVYEDPVRCVQKIKEML